MPQQFANAARAKLAQNIGAVDTTLVLETGTGALFPGANGSDWWYLTLQDDAGIEVMRVTVHAAGSDTLTVTRGQDGTLARSFAAGSMAGLRVVAADMNEAMNNRATAYVSLVDDPSDSWLVSGMVTLVNALVYFRRNIKLLLERLGLIPGSSKSTAYTLVLSDAGCSIDTMAAVTIPANASVAFPVGATVMVTNIGAAAISIFINTDTLRLAGTTTTGTRTLAGYGVATLRKVSANAWIVAGAGVT